MMSFTFICKQQTDIIKTSKTLATINTISVPTAPKLVHCVSVLKLSEMLKLYKINILQASLKSDFQIFLVFVPEVYSNYQQFRSAQIEICTPKGT